MPNKELEAIFHRPILELSFFEQALAMLSSLSHWSDLKSPDLVDHAMPSKEDDFNDLPYRHVLPLSDPS